MRLHRFFWKEKIAAEKKLVVQDKSILNQWKRVLRFEEGDKVILFDGSGSDFLFGIEKISEKVAELALIEEHGIDFKMPTDLHLIQSVIKKENFELILEKATELGLEKFVPVISERSVKLEVNLERSKKIITEAAEQSGKAIVPLISEASGLEKFLSGREKARKYIVLDPRGEKLLLKNFSGDKLGVLIGPEGGWSEIEIDLFKREGLAIFSLGQQILRSETAAIGFISLMQLGR